MPVAALLAGPVCRRLRAVAADVIDDPAALQRLLDRADAVVGDCEDADPIATLALDVAWSVLVVHVEDLQEGRLWRDEPDAECDEARYTVLVAALQRLVADPPDGGSDAQEKLRDLTELVRWVTWAPQNLLPAH
ncbi:hypothetical protein BKA23_0073 [Rudaeicoccus suwonensis]|uniref:Uncharacterized protein n=1 Tax=Rudaeicoccus suwonensis TaxID=657409 RepID=A0A561E6T2_9MICO|nr:hypothetical protein BKA23_0073 [Rudaeicoccus suwonensis]